VKRVTGKSRKPAAKAVGKRAKGGVGRLAARKAVKGRGNGKPKKAPIRRKLTAAEVRQFRELLVALRDHLSGQISSLKNDSLMRVDKVNTVEDGTDAFERQFALNIASLENDALFEIEEALRRIDAGTFGICEMSGEPIELERLKAIPYTRYSLATQAELERGKGPHRQSSVLRAL
jgi:RNA polymerase-binding transcription factor DksA